MTPSWYDVLDVDESATTDEIRAAWRRGVADLDPTDRRFRALNSAAEVLLDPERRRAHDDALAASPSDPESDAEPGAGASTAAATPAATPRVSRRDRAAARADRRAGAGDPGVASAGATTLSTDPAVEPTPSSEQVVGTDGATEADEAGATPSSTGRGGSRLVAATAVLAVLAVLLVVALVAALVRHPSDSLPSASAVATAEAAAGTALVPVLSYDYRQVAKDEQTASTYLTPGYAKTYRSYIDDIVRGNAPNSKTIVTNQVLGSGVVRTSPGQVDVLVLFNTTTNNIKGTMVAYNEATARMVDVDGRWLLDCVVTKLDGVCGKS